MIQWIACSLNEKKMKYCPYGASNLIEKYNLVLDVLRKKPVCFVYELLI
jgi:hypothetical protein